MSFILGLTGSIGMGKTATAAMFRARGVPVHDADAVVHGLYRGAAVVPIEAAFPGTGIEGIVDRAALSRLLLNAPERLKELERIVHPLVRAERDHFLNAASAARAPIAVLDIPLLFETRGEKVCDAVLVVTAPPHVQDARVLARPGLTPEKLEMIRLKQMPDIEKRKRAHFVVDTGRGFAAAERQVHDILRAVAGRVGRQIRGENAG